MRNAKICPSREEYLMVRYLWQFFFLISLTRSLPRVAYVWHCWLLLCLYFIYIYASWLSIINCWLSILSIVIINVVDYPYMCFYVYDVYVYKWMMCDILLCKIMLQEKHGKGFSNLTVATNLLNVNFWSLVFRNIRTGFVFACFFSFPA